MSTWAGSWLIPANRNPYGSSGQSDYASSGGGYGAQDYGQQSPYAAQDYGQQSPYAAHDYGHASPYEQTPHGDSGYGAQGYGQASPYGDGHAGTQRTPPPRGPREANGR